MVAPIVVLQEQREEAASTCGQREGLWSQTSPGEGMAHRGPAMDTGIQCLSLGLRSGAGSKANRSIPAPPAPQPFLNILTGFGKSSIAKRVLWTKTHTC